MLPASEAAQSWIQFAMDAGFVIAAVSSVVLMVTGHIQRAWSAIMVTVRSIRHHSNAMQFNRVRYETDVLLGEIIIEFDAMRAMLLCAEDSEFVRPSRPQKISVVTSKERDGIVSVFSRFQDEPADPQYQDLLRQVMMAEEDPEMECVFLVAKDMRTGWLADYYHDTGVVCSVVFYLRMTGHAESLYLTINFGEPLKASPDENGVMVTRPHDEETADRHMALAKSLADHPERIRRMKRPLKALWGRY